MTDHSIRSKVLGGVAVFWTVLVTVLSLLPGSSMEFMKPLFFESLDKLGHYAVYLIWALLVGSLVRRKSSVIPIAGLLGTGMTLYGMLLEFLQIHATTGRSFEWYDMLANGAGAFSGFIFLKQKKTGSHDK